MQGFWPASGGIAGPLLTSHRPPNQSPPHSAGGFNRSGARALLPRADHGPANAGSGPVSFRLGMSQGPGASRSGTGELE
jgi:hypothetical protein